MEILISGASTGIGRACAVDLAGKGHGVWAGVRREKDYEELKALNLSHLHPVYLDVTNPDSIRECVDQITEKAGTLHGLVNNAGIAVGGPLEGIPMEDWHRQFETNVFGAIALTQACLPLLRANRGRIVNMSSISGRIAVPFLAPYSASKYALEAVSDSLRRELIRFGVKVAVVEPGPIATPIWEKGRDNVLSHQDKYSPEVMRVYGRTMEKFAKRMEDTIRFAAPVSLVVKAVEHALTSAKPRIRYPVGRGIRASTVLARLLPDRWLDKVVR